jgi:hypothetical protein
MSRGPYPLVIWYGWSRGSAISPLIVPVPHPEAIPPPRALISCSAGFPLVVRVGVGADLDGLRGNPGAALHPSMSSRPRGEPPFGPSAPPKNARIE